MLTGEAVTVTLKKLVSYDEMKEPVYEHETVEVGNVLIQKSGTADLSEKRPHGDRKTAVLHFPKTFNRCLKNAEVSFWGSSWRVIGDPLWYMPQNTPTAWNYPVEVERVRG